MRGSEPFLATGRDRPCPQSVQGTAPATTRTGGSAAAALEQQRSSQIATPWLRRTRARGRPTRACPPRPLVVRAESAEGACRKTDDGLLSLPCAQTENRSAGREGESGGGGEKARQGKACQGACRVRAGGREEGSGPLRRSSEAQQQRGPHSVGESVARAALGK